MNTNDKTKVEMLKQMDVLHSLEKKKQNADNCTPPISQTTVYSMTRVLILFCAVLYVCVDFKVVV